MATTLSTAPAAVAPIIPMRPVNGGIFTYAPAKIGNWCYEPKYNGGRMVLHLPSMQLFNRHAQRSFIVRDFAAALEGVRKFRDRLLKFTDWLDIEGLSRRHGTHKGSFVVLDFLPREEKALTYLQRRRIITKVLPLAPLSPKDWTSPVYLTTSHDDGTVLWAELLANVNKGERFCNWFFEGMVAKRVESVYQTMRNDTQEAANWVKHRFQTI